MIDKIQDLTYGELLDYLRKDLQLDASTDLLHGTLDMALADLVSVPGAQVNLGVQRGQSSVTWPGGNRLTNVRTVTFATPYPAGRVPIVLVSAFATTNLEIATMTETVTQFTAQGNTVDASLPAAATTANFNWIAIG